VTHNPIRRGLVLAASLATVAAVALPGPAHSADSTAEPQSDIKHVVVIVQENHSFDNYFGPYCDATHACEGTGAANPYAPLTAGPMNDTTSMAYDPNHDQECELAEMNGGKMDQYIQPHLIESFDTTYFCGNPANFTQAPYDPASPNYYQALVSTGGAALADHYFQPIAGASSSNDMYLWTTRYEFTDNQVEPDAVGKACSTNTNVKHLGDENIGHLLSQANVGWAWYAEGYKEMHDANPQSPAQCPVPPVQCGAHIPSYPCVFDPSDIPAEYYDGVDTPEHMRDYGDLATDISHGALPPVTFVKARGYNSEHPGYGTKLSDGAAFVKNTVAAIEGNPALADNTLILVTWDESGGYFDHMAPPAPVEDYPGTATPVPYGPRVPLVALGKFVVPGTVSHAVLEHSSITKFIEWNWLGGTGQLNGRDASVANIGSLLDPESGVPAA
jgi:phospholipase C